MGHLPKKMLVRHQKGGRNQETALEKCASLRKLLSLVSHQGRRLKMIPMILVK